MYTTPVRGGGGGGGGMMSVGRAAAHTDTVS